MVLCFQVPLCHWKSIMSSHKGEKQCLELVDIFTTHRHSQKRRNFMHHTYASSFLLSLELENIIKNQIIYLPKQK